jgi:hypothetical protein
MVPPWYQGYQWYLVYIIYNIYNIIIQYIPVTYVTFVTFPLANNSDLWPFCRSIITNIPHHYFDESLFGFV